MNEMPSLLKKNMQMLAQSQPILASRLREYADGISSLPEPDYQQTAAGRWVSGLTEKPFFEKQKVLEKRAQAAPAAVYLIFGVGCAPYLFHLLRSLPREALSVIVIESSFDLLLHTLSQTSVFQALPPGCRISFITGKDRILFDEAFAWNVVPIGIFPVSTAVAIHHEGETEAVDFSEVESAFKKEVIYRLTLLGNSPEDTLLGFRHAALNAPRIVQSLKVKSIKEVYGGKPFVSVAAGPSLEKNVHLLKDIQEKCVIVACDTVLFHLLEKGIVPHIVTTIERPYEIYTAWLPRVLEKYRAECEKILLLSQSVSYPLMAGQWPGPNIIVGKLDVPVDSWFTGKVLGEQLLYSGLSVAHMNLSVALACESPSIALIGQDLAFGDGGVSHASKTISDYLLAEEQLLRKNSISVPGALGGTVETSTIWLLFIQIFERLLQHHKGTPVYDCTEGGALIEGTLITPFSDYIQESILTPQSTVSRWEQKACFQKSNSEQILANFKNAFAQLDTLDECLNDMRVGIARCSAPAILPEKRQKLAFSVAEILDRVHALNPVVSFIGQSYTHLSGSVLAENRFLENVEQVARWKELHEEIADSHSFSVSFLRQWLHYAEDLIGTIFEGAFKDAKEMSGSGENEFLDLFEEQTGQVHEEGRSNFYQLTDILSCKDPLRENWSPDSLWKAALVLFAQGRAEEGRRFMTKAYELMEGAELPPNTIGEFFKDWGKMAAADDLCVFPEAGEAIKYLANAREYLPEDEELLLLQQKVLDRQKHVLTESGKVFSNQGAQYQLLLLKNAAETALSKKDLPTALQCTEKLVWESFDDYPGTAVPHLQWLMKTAANCIDAADKKIAVLSAGILDGIVSMLPKLSGKKIEFPVEFLQYMERKGIKLSMDSSDNESDNE
ncbi:MAG: DUF115 domain-containing protein [Clostridia bacterium]|nr:DUF115 domain-containing protein [Clostridia bacterium]